MHFHPNGEQAPHLHGGPRKLDIYSAGPWSVLVGGCDPDVLKAEGRIPFTEIQFPPGYTQLSFAIGVLHGFKGGPKGFGAISTHWTDEQEKAKKNVGGSKDLMDALTEMIPPERVEVIGGKSVPNTVLAPMLADARLDRHHRVDGWNRTVLPEGVDVVGRGALLHVVLDGLRSGRRPSEIWDVLQNGQGAY